MALRPFEPGHSGNPEGRPKMSPAHRAAFKEISDLGIKSLRAILDGSDTTAKASDRIKAADIAFDRTWGRPEQEVTVGHTGKTLVDVSMLSEDEKHILARVAINAMEIEGVYADNTLQETDDQS